jgi:hypothetical protein
MEEAKRVSNPTFWVNKPCCGPEEYVCILKKILFSDGIERFICTNDQVPESYWPNTVYQFNKIESGYDEIGSYTTSSSFSTERLNPKTLSWEGNPSVKTYSFMSR